MVGKLFKFTQHVIYGDMKSIAPFQVQVANAKTTSVQRILCTAPP
jgi:hypothetical protein